jgi:hypothetical protein
MFFKRTRIGTDFVFHSLTKKNMKNFYRVRGNLTLLLLAAGVCCFGLILPDSISDHDKLVHFSAHFGMSFLVALCFYLLCTIKLRISKFLTYIILISATLLIGVLYKYWEIATLGMFDKLNFATVIENAGVMKSMSQNISGLMAAMLLIEGLVEKNLAVSGIAQDQLLAAPGSFQGISADNNLTGQMHGPFRGGSLPPGGQYSPDASEN